MEVYEPNQNYIFRIFIMYANKTNYDLKKNANNTE